ncbi:hypothetical protein ACQJBY_000158 [Aegilops geniculata]
MDEMGYLKKVKGRDSNRSVRSEIFWTGVERAVNFFEPLANLLLRMDSDVPAMGFIYGAFLDAKKEIATRFDNEEASIQEVLHIIDKRWDNKLKGPLHRAGYFLNPYYYYENKLEIELDGTFKDGLVACMEKMVRDGKKEDIMTAECQAYQNEEGSFGRDSAKRQRRNKNFDPAEWWSNHGSSAPNLRVLAMRILSMTCSSSACERNFSVFQQVQGSKRRNRLLHDKMRDLVFIKANSQLEQKRMNKDRDPLVDRTHADVVEDEDNEWITGIVPVPVVDTADEPEEEPIPQPRARAAASKRNKARRPRKKLLPVFRDDELQSVGSSSDSDDDAMAASSSDSD